VYLVLSLALAMVAKRFEVPAYQRGR
jgi:hypothetical protein